MSVKFYLDLYNRDDHCVFISKISKQSAEQKIIIFMKLQRDLCT